jgi:hydroxymethylbilane synthase
MGTHISSFLKRVKRLQSVSMSERTFKIGTRGSPLALIQANMLCDALKASHPDHAFEIIPIKSAADWKKSDPEQALDTKNGGKGQFAKEIEALILDRTLDCGVHSLKDMASFLPEGLVIEHYMARADARDAFISTKYNDVMDLPEGAVVGTCSPRRQALALAKRPDLKIVPFRGNVKTRLDKVENGQVEATYLAMAGLTRLGVNDPMIHAVEVEGMLPACGQGTVCMEMREGDDATRKILETVHNKDAGLCAIAEREVLSILDGSCHTPLAAYAILQEGQLYLRAIVASPDGQVLYEEELRAPCSNIEQAKSIGVSVGHNLKTALPEGFLD